MITEAIHFLGTSGGAEKELYVGKKKPNIDTITMEYLIRLAQMHETFRKPELEALAALHDVDLEILEYSDQVRRHLTFLCLSNLNLEQRATEPRLKQLLKSSDYRVGITMGLSLGLHGHELINTYSHHSA